MIVVLFTMKNDKWKVFLPAVCTMMGLHLMSVAFGTLFPLLFSRNSIVYFSIALFVFFGVMMIYEAYYMEPKKSEEKLAELQEGFATHNDPEASPPQSQASPSPSASHGHPANQPQTAGQGGSTLATQGPDTKLPIEVDEKEKKNLGFCSSPAMQLVLLLFFADWGDRCQISAIVLTATHNIWGVAAGGALVS